MNRSLRAAGGSSRNLSGMTVVVEKSDKKPRKRARAIHIDPKLCKGCGLCIHFCPHGVLEKSRKQNEQGYYLPQPTHLEKCRACRFCELYCPELAIFVEAEG